jgi:hypothetical protein
LTAFGVRSHPELASQLCSPGREQEPEPEQEPEQEQEQEREPDVEWADSDPIDLNAVNFSQFSRRVLHDILVSGERRRLVVRMELRFRNSTGLAV